MENKHTQYVDFSNPNADKITTGVTNKPMINKKQTAVEWLLSELEKFHHPTEAMIMYANKLHKQEIMNAHTQGYIIGGGNGDLYNCEQYYNETYGK